MQLLSLKSVMISELLWIIRIIVLPLQWIYQRPLTQSLTAYLLPSNSTQQQQMQLLEEGRLITDNVEIANIFNKHFIDGVAAYIPILSEHAFVNHLSVNEISHRCNHLQFSFHQVEVGYVKKLIDSLNRFSES